MFFGGDSVIVDVFVSGQVLFYQVIDGYLKMFDVVVKEYVDVGDVSGFKINVVGFNVEDDLIYGVVKFRGVDFFGNEVVSMDIVMIDVLGVIYCVGKGFYGDYVGDFDDSGNFWIFYSMLDWMSVVDVDNFDVNGDF